MTKTEDKDGFINCHVHVFTTKHAPAYFPHWIITPFRYLPFLLQFIRWVASWLPWDRITDFLRRIEDFHRTGSRVDQRAVFRELLHYYPRSTRFVALPLDMGDIGHGPVVEDIRQQHDGLAELAASEDYGPQLIPFGTLDPNREGGFDEFVRSVDELGFKGLKVYPKLGYAPTHDVLMNKVYPFCVERNIPVMTHCSAGGVYRKGWSTAELNEVTRPDAYEEVLKKFPDLRLCLAHFGGEDAWNDQLRVGFDPDDPEARRKNWATRIVQMIENEYENLYTDISYTIFKFERHTPLLQLMLSDPSSRLRDRILFGSDFYMTRQEELSEKSVSIRLRNTLGEEDFHRIARENPLRWLGWNEL